MANSMIQFNTDEITKLKAVGICENRGIAAMKQASQIAEENGIANMTLDEINAEINAARVREV